MDGANEVRVDPGSVSKTDLDPALAREIRASFLLAGPLLARFGRVTVPPPGGDVIGRRRLDTHVHAFAALGAEVELDGVYDLSASGLKGTRVYLDEASVMGTENAIMAAVLADGETVLGHAPVSPTSRISAGFSSRSERGSRASARTCCTSRASTSSTGRVPHRARPHRGRSFVGLAGHRRRGRGRGRRARRPDLDRACVPQARNRARCLRPRCPRSAGQRLHIEDDFGGQIPKIESGIWPAFLADLTSIAVTVATQAHGTTIFEKMFESRLFFVDKLVSMGRGSSSATLIASS